MKLIKFIKWQNYRTFKKVFYYLNISLSHITENVDKKKHNVNLLSQFIP
jgi:hypothetical protein